ncbi:MAG TPA: polysaccharide biosynthesis/export family protein, partial [Variovorax sp.]|nr:polysaccharide biosynthesis/export family protein [Variovorax sp.]
MTLLRKFCCLASAVAISCSSLGVASAQGLDANASPYDAAIRNAADPASGQGALAPLRQAPPATGLGGPSAPIPQVVPTAPQGLDYRANLQSDVFGAQLFTGAFANAGATQFNPDYLIASGDSLQVRLWGAFEFDAPLTVDPQGNVFLPHVGPVSVRGVRNQELQ